MGWMRYLLLGDVGQQLDIGDMHERLEQVEQSKSDIDRSQDGQIKDLRRENRDLKVKIAALIKLLIAKKAITAEEVAEMIAALEPENVED